MSTSADKVKFQKNTHFASASNYKTTPGTSSFRPLFCPRVAATSVIDNFNNRTKSSMSPCRGRYLHVLTRKRKEKREDSTNGEDDDVCEPPSRKLQATEERVTSRLRNFHLSDSGVGSNAYFFSQKPTESFSDIENRIEISDEEVGDIDNSADSFDGPILRVKDEFKDIFKLNAPKGRLPPITSDLIPSIPASPCTDLILWQPSIIPAMAANDDTEKSSATTNNGDNRDEIVVDWSNSEGSSSSSVGHPLNLNNDIHRYSSMSDSLELDSILNGNNNNLATSTVATASTTTNGGLKGYFNTRSATHERSLLDSNKFFASASGTAPLARLYDVNNDKFAPQLNRQDSDMEIV